MWSKLTSFQRREYFLLLAIAGVYFCSSSMLLYVPKYIVSLGGDPGIVGQIISLAIVPFVVFSIFSGQISARYGSRWLIVTGCLISFFSRMTYPCLEQVDWMFYALSFANGTGHVLVFTPLFAAVGRCIPDQHKAEGIGYFTVAIQLGNTIGTSVGEAVLKQFDYPAFFVVTALMVLFSALASLALHDRGEKAVDNVQTGAPFRLKQITPLIGGLVLILLLGGILGSTLQFIPVFFDHLLESNLIQNAIPASTFLTTALLMTAAIRFAGGRFSDGSRRFQILAVCHAGLLITLILIPHIRSSISSIIFATTFGLSYGLLYPSLNGFVLTNTPQSLRGKISGVLTLLFEVGFRGFALLAGTVSHLIGYSYMFYLLALLYFIGIFIYYVLKLTGISSSVPANAAPVPPIEV